MRKILITTTDSLQGWEIEAYLKPVFASVVIGTNILSDISASFSDFFGGRSGSYEKKLQFVKDNAIQILTSKANELGANCLLGLKVDMDEISGKNTQMFMITAYATAVIANNLTSTKEPRSLKELDKSTVGDKAALIKMLNGFQDPEYKLTTVDIVLATDNRAIEFKDHFFDRLKRHLKGVYNDAEAANKISKVFIGYFSTIDHSESMEVFYNGLFDETDARVANKLSDIILELDLVDYPRLQQMLGSEDVSKRKIALKILMGDKPFYTTDEVGGLKTTIDKVAQSFPEQGTWSIKKGGFLTDERKVWTCTCGKVNEVANKYCSECSKDIVGFKEDDIKPKEVIEYLTNKAEALQQSFRS